MVPASSQLLGEAVVLFFAAVAPIDGGRLGQLGDFLDPSDQRCFFTYSGTFSCHAVEVVLMTTPKLKNSGQQPYLALAAVLS